jgi:DNA-binding CsgD family transcriptional regulator
LTRREREIARLLSRGAGSAEIARALGVKQKTIQNQMPSLLLKLGVPDRVAAVLLLRDAELGS